MLQKAIDHLRQIGLEVVEVPGASGFAPGVRIVAGMLHVDPTCAPSALLHEAGHLATVPARFRGFMSDNLAAGMKRMFEELAALDVDPDHPLERAAVQCSDPEATAWAWAAGTAIGLAPEEIIQDTEYDNSGAEIRAMLQANQYFPAEQIVSVLKQAELGMAVGDIARQLGISEQTFYRWKKQYGGMQSEGVRELKVLQDENARLKKLVAE